MINYKDLVFAPKWFVDIVKQMPAGYHVNVSRKIKDVDNPNRVEVLFSQKCDYYLHLYLGSLGNIIDLSKTCEYLCKIDMSKISWAGFGFEIKDDSYRWKLFFRTDEDIQTFVSGSIKPNYKWHNCFYKFDISNKSTSFYVYLTFQPEDKNSLKEMFLESSYLMDFCSCIYIKLGGEPFVYFEYKGLHEFITALGFNDPKLDNLLYKGLNPYIIGFPYKDLGNRTISELNLYYK
jgi:hypothetical protein